MRQWSGKPKNFFQILIWESWKEKVPTEWRSSNRGWLMRIWWSLSRKRSCRKTSLGTRRIGSWSWDLVEGDAGSMLIDDVGDRLLDWAETCERFEEERKDSKRNRSGLNLWGGNWWQGYIEVPEDMRRWNLEERTRCWWKKMEDRKEKLETSSDQTGDVHSQYLCTHYVWCFYPITSTLFWKD